MPRTAEQNALIKEVRRKDILDAALTVYIQRGFHGTDMDAVAEEAQLAKGLIYYYFKTKKELFIALYTRMFDEGYAFSSAVLEFAEGRNPVEALMVYVYAMFGANKEHPRMMQFNIRAPFDAYAVFAPGTWTSGAYKSGAHKEALTRLISRGMEMGIIPKANPGRAANSFWTVFVANLSEYSKLISGEMPIYESDEEALRDVVRFCFQGLGIDYAVWNGCLEMVYNNGERGAIYEGLQKQQG